MREREREGTLSKVGNSFMSGGVCIKCVEVCQCVNQFGFQTRSTFQAIVHRIGERLSSQLVQPLHQLEEPLRG